MYSSRSTNHYLCFNITTEILTGFLLQSLSKLKLQPSNTVESGSNDNQYVNITIIIIQL